MLPEEKPDEELYKNNQKSLQNIVRKFLYYARAIEPTMLMALNSLAVAQTNPTIKTEKNIT